MMKEIKNTLKTGVASMGGMYALGTMEKLPGMPKQASTVTSVAGAGLALANTGQLLNTAMGVMPKTKGMTKKKLSGFDNPSLYKLKK